MLSYYYSFSHSFSHSSHTYFLTPNTVLICARRTRSVHTLLRRALGRVCLLYKCRTRRLFDIINALSLSTTNTIQRLSTPATSKRLTWKYMTFYQILRIRIVIMLAWLMTSKSVCAHEWALRACVRVCACACACACVCVSSYARAGMFVLVYLDAFDCLMKKNEYFCSVQIRPIVHDCTPRSCFSCRRTRWRPAWLSWWSCQPTWEPVSFVLRTYDRCHYYRAFPVELIWPETGTIRACIWYSNIWYSNIL